MSNCICFNCGAKMVEYKFRFNKGLARSLYLMAKRSYYDIVKRGTDGTVEISTLKLSTTQWTNFQKLRYWGLIEKPSVIDESGKGGHWRMTELGRSFITGIVAIDENVIMYRNKVVRFEGKKIKFSDVTGGYEYRQDYADQATQQIRGM